jgi:hypothetical protein
MNDLVSLIRLPFGLLASVVVIGLAGLFFLYIELPFAIISFPFMAIFMSRYDLQNSWISSFPNSLNWARERLRNIWEWVQEN